MYRMITNTMINPARSKKRFASCLQNLARSFFSAYCTSKRTLNNFFFFLFISELF